MASEIERKFMITNLNYFTKCKGIRIVQAFLNSTPERTVRVRIKGVQAFLTIKGKNNESGTTRQEFEYKIPLNDAEQLLLLCEPGKIEKTRYEIVYKNHTFEADIFTGENEGLSLCEIELSNEDEEFEKPEWLGVEVTGDVRFYNSVIAKHPYKHNQEYYSLEKRIVK